MSSVNWDVFEGLPGSADYNFEIVCRILVRRHYGRYGYFSALTNQPGVEFDLRLHSTCALGEPGRWYGWQCKWFDLPRARDIGSTRRGIIESAIRTTEKHKPDLTDWVLWTKYPLTKNDQEWYYKIDTEMQLHLWNEVELEEHFKGDGEIVRGSYFGELVFSVDTLSNLHKERTASLKNRWQPEVHQTLEVERTIRQILGDTSSWDDLIKYSKTIEASVNILDTAVEHIVDTLAVEIKEASNLFHIVASTLLEIHTNLNQGNLDILQHNLTNLPDVPSKRISAIPRKLRALNHPIALNVTNFFADFFESYKVLNRLKSLIEISFVAVSAKAGYGKTQLSAQLTMESTTRPAGVLLHGGYLQGGENLDDLAAGQIVIQGEPISSMEALVAAVDAAGQRAKSRLPIVIDGLNEAEDPRDWKNLLASLEEVIKKYPYVLIICTLRPDFIDEALPSNTKIFNIPGFGEDIDEAIRRYFKYYKINPTETKLPMGILDHPLTLRIFCDVINPNREEEVGIEAIPESLTGLFIRYLDLAAGRITELASRDYRYYKQDVQKAYREIGNALWENRSRRIDEIDLRDRLNDTDRPWNTSIVRALEQEGILLRTSEKDTAQISVTAIYDALAGHLIADSILRQIGSTSFDSWIRESEIQKLFNGPFPDRHPLYQDILDALIGLLPRLFYQKQLWQLLEEPMRRIALSKAADLEVEFLDIETVNKLAELVSQETGVGLRDIFYRLWFTRSGIKHPLNADFVDNVLRNMSTHDRDLRWTEWVRKNKKDIISDLQRLEERWTNSKDRSPIDFLYAKWTMWTLTSTVRNLRDQATRSLYWYGRVSPESLFDITISALEISDSYVSERMLAAAYGVTMACQHNFNDSSFNKKILPIYSLKLFEFMFKEKAPYSTKHILARDYARRTIDIALIHNPNMLTKEEQKRIGPPYVDGGIRDWGESEDKNAGEYREGNAPVQMDFENYTIGRLVRGRGN